jgi:hypothetical protein
VVTLIADQNIGRNRWNYVCNARRRKHCEQQLRAICPDCFQQWCLATPLNPMVHHGEETTWHTSRIVDLGCWYFTTLVRRNTNLATPTILLLSHRILLARRLAEHSCDGDWYSAECRGYLQHSRFDISSPGRHCRSGCRYWCFL